MTNSSIESKSTGEKKESLIQIREGRTPDLDTDVLMNADKAEVERIFNTHTASILRQPVPLEALFTGKMLESFQRPQTIWKFEDVAKVLMLYMDGKSANDILKAINTYIGKFQMEGLNSLLHRAKSDLLGKIRIEVRRAKKQEEILYPQDPTLENYLSMLEARADMPRQKIFKPYEYSTNSGSGGYRMRHKTLYTPSVAIEALYQLCCKRETYPTLVRMFSSKVDKGYLSEQDFSVFYNRVLTEEGKAALGLGRKKAGKS